MTIIRLLMSNRWAQGLALGAAVVAAVFLLDRCAERAMRTVARSATEAGRQTERAEGMQETITRTKEANDAAETIRRDPDARYTECLRHARNPGDC